MKRGKAILLLAAAGGAVLLLDPGRHLTLESLKANREALLSFASARPAAAAAAFVSTYVAAAALSLPGAAILSLAAGAIFGTALGTAYAALGATIGATVSFLLTRHLFRDFVHEKFGPRLERLNRELEARGLNYLLFLRFVPVFPFFLVNLAAAMTRLPFRTFLLGTAIGVVPGGFVYVNAGAGLAAVSSLSDVATPRVLASLALLGLFAVAPVFYNRFRAGKGSSSLR